MKHKLLNKLWLRVGMIVAIMTTALSGTVWAEEYTIGWGTAIGNEGTYTNFTATSGIVPSLLSFETAQNQSANPPIYNSNNEDLRLYYGSNGNGCSITLSPVSGVTITGFVITTTTEPTVRYAVNGDSDINIEASNKTYTVTGISATSSLKIQNGNTTNTQLRIKTIKITYTTSGGNTPTFEHAGTAEDPYTVADARAAIDAGVGTTGVYVSGIVCTASSNLYSEKYLSYYISDDGTTTNRLEAYNGLGIGGADFTSVDDVQVGDEVVVYGNLTKYNTTYELAADNQLVSLVRPASIRLTSPINATPTGSVDYLPISYSNLEINAASDFGIQFYDASNNPITMPDWLMAEVQAEGEGYSVYYSISVNTDATRTAYFKVYSGETYSNLVTITQTATTIATLPFSFNGGKAAIESTDGLTQTGLGADYSAAPLLKFDDTGDELVLVFNARPGVLTFDIKGNSFSGGTFKVQASSDGMTFSDVATYTTLSSTTERMTISNLAASVRFIKWVYTQKASGNVGLGNIKLMDYVLRSLTIDNPANVTITANYGDEVLNNGDAESVLQGTEVTLAITPASGYDLQSLTIAGAEEGQTVTPVASSTPGIYTFTMPAYDVTVSATVVKHVGPAIASYVLATSITSGRRYVITNGNEDGTVQVMAEQRNNNRGAVGAAITNGVLRVSEEYEFVIEGNADDGYTIYDESEAGYLYAASSSDNYLRTKAELDENNNGVWAIEFNGETGVASVVAKGSNARKVMQYNPNTNNNNPLFACYGSASQSPVYLFEKIYTPATITLNTSGYATFASTSAVDFTDAEGNGYSAWAVMGVSGTDITFQQITGAVEAGTGVLLKGEASATISPVYVASGDAVSGNKLVGITTATHIEADQYYGLSGREFKKVKAGTVPAGKALLPASVVNGSGVKTLNFVFEDDATAIKTIDNGQLTTEGVIYNVAGQRMSKMQKGINIVNGKKILK